MTAQEKLDLLIRLDADLSKILPYYISETPDEILEDIELVLKIRALCEAYPRPSSAFGCVVAVIGTKISTFISLLADPGTLQEMEDD